MVERSTWPSEEEVYAARRELHDLELDGVLIGRVQSYDAATQTADIVPMVRQPIPREDGLYDFEDLPMLPCVPILWPRVGPWFIAMSIEPGDSVLCICLAADYASWWVSRATEGATGLDRAMRGRVVPGDLRRHHLAHAVAIPMGMEHRHNALRNAPRHNVLSDPRLVIGTDNAEGTRLGFFDDGTVRVTRGTETAFQIDPDRTVHAGGAPAATKPLAVAELVDALAQSLKDHIAAWVPVPTDGGASLKAHIAAWAPPSVAATKARGV